jgi:hypothetical protein
MIHCDWQDDPWTVSVPVGWTMLRYLNRQEFGNSQKGSHFELLRILKTSNVWAEG